jgi:hypothetical protein
VASIAADNNQIVSSGNAAFAPPVHWDVAPDNQSPYEHNTSTAMTVMKAPGKLQFVVA